MKAFWALSPVMWEMLIAMVGRTFPVLVVRCRCKSIDRLSNRVVVGAVDDVISGGHDDNDWISTVDAVDVSVESDGAVVMLHHIEGDVSRRDYQVEHELVCAMIVYVVRMVGSSVLLLLGHDGMGLSGSCISGRMDQGRDTFHGWDDWGYIPTNADPTQQVHWCVREPVMSKRGVSDMVLLQTGKKGKRKREVKRGNQYDSRHTVVCLSRDKPVLAVVVTHCVLSDDFIGGDDGDT